MWNLPWGAYTAAEVTQDVGPWWESWGSRTPQAEVACYAHAQRALERYAALRFPFGVYRGLHLPNAQAAERAEDAQGGGWFWSLDPAVAASFSVERDTPRKRRGTILRGVFTSVEQFTEADVLNYEIGKYSLFTPVPEWVVVGQPAQVEVLGGPHPWVRL